jgi:hypothetical protein
MAIQDRPLLWLHHHSFHHTTVPRDALSPSPPTMTTAVISSPPKNPSTSPKPGGGNADPDAQADAEEEEEGEG